MIDFTEIENGSRFEDFVFELLMKKPEVKELKKTGVGADVGADLKFNLENVILGESYISKVIVECKYSIDSSKNLNKGRIQPFEALSNNDASIYLLVTNMKIGAYYTTLFNASKNSPKYNDVKLIYFDHSYLERELVKQENEDVLLRFLPKSYEKVKRLKDLSFSSFKKLKDKAIKQIYVKGQNEFTKNPVMKNIYIISNAIDKNILQEGGLKKIAQENKIELSTSQDVIEDWFFSFDKIINYDRFIENSDSIFGIITTESAKSPHIWIEVERAKSIGKLKILFIEEKVYSIFLHKQYPCVLIKSNLNETLEDFQNYYRSVFQEWGSASNDLFWFALDIILSIFNSKTNIKSYGSN